MVKVELNGNYNIYIQDLNFEFTPLKPIKYFKEDEYESSRDIVPLVGTFFKVTHDVEEEKETVNYIDIVEKQVDVIEIPPSEETNDVIDATDASTTSEHIGKPMEESTSKEIDLESEGVVVADESNTNNTTKKSAGRPKKKK